MPVNNRKELSEDHKPENCKGERTRMDGGGGTRWGGRAGKKSKGERHHLVQSPS